MSSGLKCKRETSAKAKLWTVHEVTYHMPSVGCKQQVVIRGKTFLQVKVNDFTIEKKANIVLRDQCRPCARVLATRQVEKYMERIN